MANARFVLKEPNCKDETLIYLLYNFNNQRLKYSFNEKINPKFWNVDKQRVKETKVFPEYPEFNSRLDNIETSVNNAYRKLVNDNVTPTPQLLRKLLNDTLADKKQVIKTVTLFGFIEDLIENSTQTRLTRTSYRQSFRVLKEYSRDRRIELSFDSIDLSFYNDYINYLRDRGYAENTVGSHIKRLKVFMNEAWERKLTSNMDFKSLRFKKPYEITEKIYLNLQEIEKLYQLDLSKNKKLESVRDLFVIGCYTGLRFSDLSRVSTDNFINDNTQLKMKTQKTGEFVVIPLHKVVKDIVAKYDNEIPKVISNQKMNDYLKEIAQLAELNDRISVAITRGGIKQTSVFEKWELVTTHTARRSFATNMYLLETAVI